MFRRFYTAGLAFALLPLIAGIAADEKITLAVPGIQCPRCIESLTGTLSKLDSSVKVTATLETKQLEVTYDPARVSTHQLVAAVSEAPPQHNKRYEGGLLVTVEEPVKNASKIKKALGQVKGIGNYMTMPGGTPESGDIMIILRPLAPNAKPADQVKASQISDALEKNGIKFSGLPGGGGGFRGFAEEPDTKKRPGLAKTGTKPKLGDDMPLEKSKTARPAPPPPRSRPARATDSSLTKSKEKEDDSEDRPRFVILAGDSDKVYLVDHETKSDDGKELKKLVKEGDKFGDYVIKEVGDDDGLYVILENARSKETIRVEHKKKDKDADKSKEHSDTKKDTPDEGKKQAKSKGDS
jgi:copper chaperone CopZ